MGIETMSKLNQVADAGPSEHQQAACSDDSVMPFALIQVRLFKSDFVEGKSDQDHDRANRQKLAEVLEGFEKVLKVSSHTGYSAFREVLGYAAVPFLFGLAGTVFGTWIGFDFATAILAVYGK
jgi:hypothetical protein